MREKRNEMRRWSCVFALLLVIMLSACDSFDCKLDNTINLQMAFYDESGQSVQLDDTLSVMAVGTDSVLLNRSLRTHEIKVPMSHYRECDSLVLKIWGDGYEVYDTMVVQKTNLEFFEGLDCPVKVKHTLTGVTSTHTVIKDVVIVSPNVDYQHVENIKIIVGTAAQ